MESDCLFFEWEGSIFPVIGCIPVLMIFLIQEDPNKSSMKGICYLGFFFSSGIFKSEMLPTLTTSLLDD
jgi:hypothetical protein